MSSCEFDWKAGTRPFIEPPGESFGVGSRLPLINSGQAPGDPRRSRHHPTPRPTSSEGWPSREHPDRHHAARHRRDPGVVRPNLGMMGMHGEAWVNTAISRPTSSSRSACVSTTASPATSRPTRSTPRRSTSRSTLRSQQEREGRRSADRRRTSANRRQLVMPKGADHAAWLAQIWDLIGDAASATSRPAGRGHPRGACDQRHLAHHRRRRSIVVTDVGQHQMREAQHAHHETTAALAHHPGGLGTMGFAPWRRSAPRSASPTLKWVVVGDGGFQMTLCELGPWCRKN